MLFSKISPIFSDRVFIYFFHIHFFFKWIYLAKTLSPGYTLRTRASVAVHLIPTRFVFRRKCEITMVVRWKKIYIIISYEETVFFFWFVWLDSRHRQRNSTVALNYAIRFGLCRKFGWTTRPTILLHVFESRAFIILSKWINHTGETMEKINLKLK